MAATVADAATTASRAWWRRWIGLHVGFALTAVVVLWLPVPAQGWRVLGLVVGYHVACVLTARLGNDPVLWRAWTILAPLSVLMVLPDWFLSDVLGTLSFTVEGGPYLGTVPLAMAGMWTIALMPVVGCAWWARERAGTPTAVAAAAAGGAVMFVGAELAAPVLGLWEPAGVATVAGIATYVLLPELVLSVAAAMLVCFADALPRPALAGLTVLLPFTYLGLLASGYQFLG
jgi:hypothetical protein